MLEEAPEVVVPAQIDEYMFKGTIGEGAFSVVKLVLSKKTMEYYACKVIPRERIMNSELEDRFEIEIRIDQQLHHPNIVPIIDLLKDETNFYVIMEFCPNGDYFQYIVDNGPLTEETAAYFMKQLLEALKYIHSIGIAHRDLKPENLLLDVQSNIKLSDFGLSRYVGEHGLVETPCGSPCYASPECLSGEAYEGCKSDIWSCGVILFASLTGQLPWTKRNQQQLFEQIRRGEYVIPTFLSDICQNFIARLMTVDTEKRITIDQALNHPFILAGSPQIPTEMAPIPPLLSIKKVDEFFDVDKDIDYSHYTVPEPHTGRLITFQQASRLVNNNTFKSTSSPSSTKKPTISNSPSSNLPPIPGYKTTSSMDSHDIKLPKLNNSLANKRTASRLAMKKPMIQPTLSKHFVKPPSSLTTKDKKKY